MGNKKYYEELGWFSPVELMKSAILARESDQGLASLLSQLSVLRTQDSLELETEFATMIQEWLMEHVPALRESNIINKAKYN